RPPVVFLIAAPDSVAIPQLDQIPDARTVRITADTGDVDRIERILRSAHQAALANDDRLQWADRGWWLAWPVALLVALWFRRGWTMRWAAITLAAYLAAAPGTAHADGWIDWFLTPDQQGWLAYKDKRFADAGDLFQDPMWQGYAKYRAGQYEDAITVFQRLDTPDAAFAQGMAEIKNRQYRPAVRSFETALERQPDFPEAAENLDIAKAIVAFVETTREQSDTGEESGIGADDVVFDNETAQGAETRIDAVDDGASSVNPDQWIEAIDTDMGDFLRSRFRLENAQRGQ
ncbi:MAG: VWA domain-containing protein, partial [Pseudomonadota bacterium]